MFVIRPIRREDLKRFNQFANKAQWGITSLARDENILNEKIQHSIRSFDSDIQELKDEYYLFVLEDFTTGEVGGISAIQSVSGIPDPMYFYEINTIKEPRPLRVLKPISIYKGPSEICTLYLDPSFRKEGLGRLLSMCRFLFIDAFPFRFHNTIYANMRGVITKEGEASFWNGIGRHFFDLNFTQVQTLIAKGRDFIADIIPPFPIFIDLLPVEIQQTIGKVHENTVPALNMLLEQGFEYTNQVDFFDGGPKIAVERDNIMAIKQRQRGKITAIVDTAPVGNPYLISNQKIDFRACFGTLNPSEISIDRLTATALNVEIGEEISFTPLPTKESHVRSLH